MSKLGHLSKQLIDEVVFTIWPLFWVTYPNNPYEIIMQHTQSASLVHDALNLCQRSPMEK